MNEFVYVGKIVNTHGIRGELRLLSNFSHKKEAFKKGMSLYIGRDKICESITGYRTHKCFDMITLKGYTNINEVLKYKNALCYVLRRDLKLAENEYLEEDLVGMDVYIDDKKKERASVLKVETVTPYNKILWIRVSPSEKEIAVPLVPEFVQVLPKENKIMIKSIAGLIE